MERLTDTTGQLYACGNGLCNFEPKQMCSDCKYQHEANNQLAAYEDLNATPEQCKAALELLHKKEENKIVELPIGIGKSGFLICSTGVVIPAIVSHITLNDNKFCTPIIKFRSPYTGGICGQMPLNKANELFYETKEAAEKAKERYGE